MRRRTDYPEGVGDDSGQCQRVWSRRTRFETPLNAEETLVNNIVYIVGAVVIIVALLSFFGLR